jgi:uncharacterized repeat protein (TIGR03987 family)
LFCLVFENSIEKGDARTGNVEIAAILISLALVFYSIGVWSERLAGRLAAWHLIFFWVGLVFDTAGTALMMERLGSITLDVHGLSGVLAIVLMAIHAIWATAVLVRKDERAIANFHKFSVVVWAIWLVPYFTGFTGSMGGE